MARARAVTGAVVGGTTAAALGAAFAATRRWARTIDPCGPDPLAVPPGDTSVLVTNDGARLHLLVARPAPNPRRRHQSSSPDAISGDIDGVFGAEDGRDVAEAVASAAGGLAASAASDPAASAASELAPVVLPHCWTGDHRVWGAVAERLVARGHTVVLYDQRGHGRSTVGDAGTTLEALGNDLRSVLEHLDVRGAVVAGHSMGGMSVQSFAADHPDVAAERTVGFVLVATAAAPRVEMTMPVAMPLMSGTALDRTSAALIGHPRVERLIAARRGGALALRFVVGRRPSLATLAATAETFVGTPPATRRGFLREFQTMDLRPGLGAITQPTVVVCGTHDRLTPPPSSTELADLIADARLEWIDGAGHMLPFEAPDRIVEVIVELADARSPAAARGSAPVDNASTS